MTSREYIVYALVSTVNPRKTYVGVTNNPTRRLRQHDGVITGGARATRAHRPWRFLFHVKGLTHREALQLEYALKRKRVSGVSGPLGRKRTLVRLMTQVTRWTRNAPLLSTIRHHIKIVYF